MTPLATNETISLEFFFIDIYMLLSFNALYASE